MSSVFPFICLLLSLVSLFNVGQGHLYQLGEMVRLKTKWGAEQFISYGNYCGKGGSGIPVDPIDQCCHDHDMCYRVIRLKNEAGGCGKDYGNYLTYYKWQQKAKDIKCLNDGTSSDPKEVCLSELCHCDSIFATCLQEHMYYYDFTKLHWIPFRSIFNQGRNDPNQLTRIVNQIRETRLK